MSAHPPLPRDIQNTLPQDFHLWILAARMSLIPETTQKEIAEEVDRTPRTIRRWQKDRRWALAKRFARLNRSEELIDKIEEAFFGLVDRLVKAGDPGHVHALLAIYRAIKGDDGKPGGTTVNVKAEAHASSSSPMLVVRSLEEVKPADPKEVRFNLGLPPVSEFLDQIEEVQES